MITSLLALVVVLLGVAPTLSWLFSTSQPVINTFSGGTIAIKLDEALVDADGKAIEGEGAQRVTANRYKYVAGAVLDKDPTATVLKGSESETDVVLPPVFTTVTVSEELTSEDIETLGERTICVTAYAVQTHSLTEKDAIALAVTQFLPDNTPADTPIIE